MSTRRPLEGLRVVEVGVALAGPFSGSLLAELGAHVIKIERPGGGDPMRLMGPSVGDTTVWWGVAARAKLCVDLDLKDPAAREVFLGLVKGADVMVENYRPGVLDRLGLGWPALKALNPRLVMLSISGFGQTGPLSGRPGFGKIAEAMSGIVALTGKPDDVPMHIGFSLADTATGLMGTFGVALALFQRDVGTRRALAGNAGLAGQPGAGAAAGAVGGAGTGADARASAPAAAEGAAAAGSGHGTRVDVALFEPLFRIAECQLALCERLGRPPMREGSNHPYGWGASGTDDALVPLQCADGHWIMTAAPSDDTLAAMAASLDVEAALASLAERGIEAARVHDGASIATGAYFRARGDVRDTVDPRIGPLTVPGEMAKPYDGPTPPLFRATRPDEDRHVLG